MQFQKRWFVLKGNLLFYFENKTSKEPYGVIILEGCMIDLAEEDQERFGFKISWKGDRTRVYHFGTEFQVSLFTLHHLQKISVGIKQPATSKRRFRVRISILCMYYIIQKRASERAASFPEGCEYHQITNCISAGSCNMG